MGLAEVRELEGLKTEMDKLAIHLEELDADIDADAVSGIMRALLVGHTAEKIIEDYALEDEDGL
jgi:hypothetical protein